MSTATATQEEERAGARRDATLSRFATAVLMVTVVALYWRHELFATRAVTIGLQVAAVLLMFWARSIMRGRSFHAGAEPTAGDLVTSGPYHLIRHPIYSATLLFVWTGVMSHVSFVSIGLASVTSVLVAIRILTEERLLRRHFPGYESYAGRTWRVVPFVL